MEIKKISIYPGNYMEGRKNYETPRAIVIHVMDGSLKGTIGWFKSKYSRVSSHYGISTKGEVVQFVDEEDTAFHAGVVIKPTWKLIDNFLHVNAATIGIEFEGKSTDLWTVEQYKVGSELIADICLRYNIPIDRDHIVGHKEIKSTKTCPGKGDVDRLVSEAKNA